MEFSAKTRLPLQLWRYHLPFAVTHVTLNGMNLHSYLFYHLRENIRPQRGRKMLKGSQVLCFWRLMPKGEKILSPKQKDRTTISKKIEINFNWCIFQVVSNSQLIWENKISNWYLSQKPPWKLRGEFIQGLLSYSQRKSIWNRGRNFKS
jgi:hypothetical protein